METKYPKAAGYTPAEREKYEYIDKASEEIAEAVRRDGPYSHNIIRIVLEQVETKYGRAAANNLICEHNLKTRYGFTLK